jgi:hypothetical protein
MRAVVRDLAASGQAEPKLRLTARVGAGLVAQLLRAGHLFEGIDGRVYLTPLTIEELAAHPSWAPDEDARLRALWPTGLAIHAIAESLGRSGGDCMQRAWALKLERGGEAFEVSAPAWRIRRLRLLIEEAERRGLDPRDDGADLTHRALVGRFRKGRAGAPEFARRAWSAEEVKALRKLRRANATVSSIGQRLGRSRLSVQMKLIALGLTRPQGWSLEEDRAIAEGREQGHSDRRISERLPGRSRDAVGRRARELGLRRWAQRPYTPEENQALIDLVAAGGVVAAWARAHGRSVGGVYQQIRRLGLKAGASPQRFTAAEDRRIRQGYARGERLASIGAALGRKPETIAHRAQRLGCASAPKREAA